MSKSYFYSIHSSLLLGIWPQKWFSGVKWVSGSCQSNYFKMLLVLNDFHFFMYNYLSYKMLNMRYHVVCCKNSSYKYWFSTSLKVHSGEIPSSSLRPFFFPSLFLHFLHILSTFGIFPVLWTEGLEPYSKHFYNQGIKSSDYVCWTCKFSFQRWLFLNGRRGLWSGQADALSLSVLWSFMAATGRLFGSSEKFHRGVKGKDFCLSFLPKDGTLGWCCVFGI